MDRDRLIYIVMQKKLPAPICDIIFIEVIGMIQALTYLEPVDMIPLFPLKKTECERQKFWSVNTIT